MLDFFQPWLIAAYIVFVIAMATGGAITGPWAGRMADGGGERDRSPFLGPRFVLVHRTSTSMTEGNAAPPERIREMFDQIADIYDGMNALISGFQEPRWRRRAVRGAALGPGMRALDVACGTGKVAADLHRAVTPGGAVVGVDVSTRMIERARARFGRTGLTFLIGDALALPVEDATFDAATIAFGMRNLADYQRAFAEMRRAVRPGGRVVCLEIARPRRLVGRLIARWFDHVVPLLGRFVGQGDAYTYLVRSVRAYPSPDRVAEIMTQAGLTDVRWFGLSGGIVTIHVAIRR